MKNHLIGFMLFAVVLGIWCLTPTSAAGQSLTSKSAATAAIPEFNGVWQAPYTPDLTKALGHELPYTPYGVERFKKVVHADDPASYCLPVGPARGIQAPMPFQIVQSPGLVAILFEYQRTYRLIYTDGRSHPDDLDPFRWFGDSTGKWEGDTLVVDTVGIGDRTWLDTAGHQHSDQLHLTERFQKVDANNMKWSVTFNDPKMYKEPFTVSLPLKRQNTVIMMYSCEENEKDRGHLDSAKQSEKPGETK
jgi:hypothetical protein